LLSSVPPRPPSVTLDVTEEKGYCTNPGLSYLGTSTLCSRVEFSAFPGPAALAAHLGVASLPGEAPEDGLSERAALVSCLASVTQPARHSSQWQAVPSLLPLLSVALRRSPSTDLACEEQHSSSQGEHLLRSEASQPPAHDQPVAGNPPSSDPPERPLRADSDPPPDLTAMAPNEGMHLNPLMSLPNPCNSSMPAGSHSVPGTPTRCTDFLPCEEDHWANGPPPINYDPFAEDPIPEAWELVDLEDFFGPAALTM